MSDPILENPEAAMWLSEAIADLKPPEDIKHEVDVVRAWLLSQIAGIRNDYGVSLRSLEGIPVTHCRSCGQRVRIDASQIKCNKCGKPMKFCEAVDKFNPGKMFKFLGCTGYPECKNAMSITKFLVEYLEAKGKRLTVEETRMIEL